MITKYGTYKMYQNIETDEVKEIPLADEEELKKYAEDSSWKEVGVDSKDSSRTSGQSDPDKKKEF